MLKKLLHSVAGKGTERASELACALGVSQALVREMLEELARQGYLQAVVQECSTSCEACSLQARRLFCKQPKVWALTKKGESVLGGK